jgi:hypothetical protein
VIIDPVVLREFAGLMARAIAWGDGAGLRAFQMERRRRHMWRVATRMTWLDPEVLVAAVADIRSLERCPLRTTPQGQRLLQVAGAISTRPRQVLTYAYEKLQRRSARLRRLIAFGAPPFIVADQVGMVLEAFDAIETNDVAYLGGSEFDDSERGEHCLTLARVVDTTEVGMKEVGFQQCFVRGPELFPRPTGQKEAAGWARFCVGFRPEGPPVVAMGKELLATMCRTRDAWRVVRNDLGIGSTVRESLARALTEYVTALMDAREKGLAVVEWLWSDEDFMSRRLTPMQLGA